MKKTVSLVLAIIMIVGVFVSVPFTAGAETVINTVAITVTAPVAGQKPSGEAVCGAGYHLHEAVSWYNSTDKENVSADETFEEGKEYAANIFIDPNDGYVFNANGKTSLLTATVNGYNATVLEVYSYSPAEFIHISYRFSAGSSGGDTPPQQIQIINDVNIKGVKAPIAGANASFNADTDDSGYTITDVGWKQDNSWLNESSEFESGTEYSLYVWITADDGYQFSVDSSENSTVNAYVNSKKANVGKHQISDKANKNLVVIYKYVASDEPYTYNVINDNEAEITGYLDSEPIISIPSSIDGYRVTKIAKQAFYDNDDIEEVVFPDTLENIGDEACSDCSSITDVTFNDGLKKIGFSAFDSCDSLGEVDIPETVESIGASAFSSCHALRYVWLYEGLQTIDGYAFYNCENLKEVSVPDSVFQIISKAFGYKYNASEETQEPVDGFVLSGYAGSAAENYAKNHSLTFNYLPIPVTVKIKKSMFTYTGKAIKPSVTVTDMRGDKLVKDTDYTLVYPKSPVNVGSYTIDVKLKGKYSGVEFALYVIKAAKNPMTVKATAKTVKYKTVKKKNVTVKPLTVKKAQGTVTYKKLKGSKMITVNKKTGKFTVKKGIKKKTYTIKVKVSAKGNKNYESLSKTVNVKIKVK